MNKIPEDIREELRKEQEINKAKKKQPPFLDKNGKSRNWFFVFTGMNK